jgi:hypothetical protein
VPHQQEKKETYILPLRAGLARSLGRATRSTMTSGARRGGYVLNFSTFHLVKHSPAEAAWRWRWVGGWGGAKHLRHTRPTHTHTTGGFVIPSRERYYARRLLSSPSPILGYWASGAALPAHPAAYAACINGCGAEEKQSMWRYLLLLLHAMAQILNSGFRPLSYSHTQLSQ